MARGKTTPRWQVFLSSVFVELRDYRRVVHRRVSADQRLNQAINLVALDRGPKVSVDGQSLSRRAVRDSDLLLLLLGRGLGSRTTPGGRAFTEDEVRVAISLGIPVLAFELPTAPGDASNGAFEGVEPENRWGPYRYDQFRRYLQEMKSAAAFPAEAEDLSTPQRLGAAVAAALADWYEGHARPTHISKGGHDMLRRTDRALIRVPLTTDRRYELFVDHKEPYQRLRQNVLSGDSSVLVGPSGAGKSTLVAALCGDPDIVRAYSSALRRPVDPALLRQPAMFEVDFPPSLTPGATELLSVPIQSVWAMREGETADGQLDVSPLGNFLRQCFGKGGQLSEGYTTIFEVLDERTAAQLCDRLGLPHGQATIRVNDFTLDAAVEFLRLQLTEHQTSHAECETCWRLLPGVAHAAGMRPTVLAICAARMGERAANGDEALHAYLHNVHRAIVDLPVEDARFVTIEQEEKSLSEGLRRGLQAAAVFLPEPFSFSNEDVQAVAGIADVFGSLSELRNRRFLETVRVTTKSGRSEEQWAMHPLIWSYMRRIVPRTTLVELRMAALTRLDAQLNAYFNDMSFHGWFELERGRQQSLLANWLHAIGEAGERQRAAEALTRLYLKGLWWWGMFIDFEFCDLLLHVANRLSPQWSTGSTTEDSLSQATHLLSQIHDHYPKMGQFDDPPDPEAARQDWLRVDLALQSLANLLGVPSDGSTEAFRVWQPSPDSTRASVLIDVAKLINVFRAHAGRCFFGELRLGAETARRIDRHYRAALILAKRGHDAWNQPWFWCERGEAKLEAMEARLRGHEGLLRQARTYSGMALSRARKRTGYHVDFEILANCERLDSEIERNAEPGTLPRERLVSVAAHCARAMHYALCFEVWPEGPDAYTARFSREQQWRSLVMILELASSEGAQSIEAATSTLAEFFRGNPETLHQTVIQLSVEWPVWNWATRRDALPTLLRAVGHMPTAPHEWQDIAGAARKDFIYEATAEIRDRERRYPDLKRLP